MSTVFRMRQDDENEQTYSFFNTDFSDGFLDWPTNDPCIMLRF
jgi:hypothetical protein